MNRVFLRFPSRRSFVAVQDITKARNQKRAYFLFFDVKALKKYFVLDQKLADRGCGCFYLQPSEYGIKNLTGKQGYYFIVLCDSSTLYDFFSKNVYPILENKSKSEYVILSEEFSENREVLEVTEELATVFYLPAGEELIPIAYSPFNYHELPFQLNKESADLLSFGCENSFSIAYLDNGKITVSPNFGELESLYEIDAMDLLVNTIVGHSGFKNLSILRDENNFSMISDYIRRFAAVKKISHIHSHFANLLADHGFWKEKGIGVVYDNLSYDLNNQIQGGEILYGSLGHFVQAGSWKPVLLPGGSISNIEPWRITLAMIRESGKKSLNEINLPVVKKIRDKTDFKTIFEAIDNKSINYDISTSMHHILSAAGEMLEFEENTFDLEYFENRMDPFSVYGKDEEHFKIPIHEENGEFQADTISLFKGLTADLLEHRRGDHMLRKVMYSIALATANLVEKISKQKKEKKIFLCGESFKHPNFLNLVKGELEKRGMKVFVPKQIPLDDSGITVGQIIQHLFEKKRS